MSWILIASRNFIGQFFRQPKYYLPLLVIQNNGGSMNAMFGQERGFLVIPCSHGWQDAARKKQPEKRWLLRNIS